MLSQETLSKTVIKSTFLIGLLLAGGCDSFKPIDSCDLADEPLDSNYTRTGVGGNQLFTDSKDWRVSQKYSLYVQILTPGFPNPPIDSTSNVRLTIYDTLNGLLNNIDIVAKNTSGNYVSVLGNIGRQFSTPATGTWELPIDLRYLSSSAKFKDVPRQQLYRLYIIHMPNDFDFCESLISYGDIWIGN